MGIRTKMWVGLTVLGWLAAHAGIDAPAQAEEVTVYSARQIEADRKAFALFTKETGIEVKVVKDDIAPLIEQLRAEAASSPADLVIAADAGNLWEIDQAGLFQAVSSARLDEAVPPALRDPAGHWFGTTIRVRAILYDKTRIDPAQLSTYEALADPKWRDKLLVRSSSHALNQSLMASIIAADGPEKAKAWAKGLVVNFARPPQGGDTDQIKALAAGEGQVAIANLHFLGRMLASEKTGERDTARRIGVFFPNQQGRGAHVNISGAGVARYAPNPKAAVRLLEFLVREDVQKIYAEGNYEFPLHPEQAKSPILRAWGPFKADTLDVAQLGRLNALAVDLMDRAGWR